MKYYKVLDGMNSCHGGVHVWQQGVKTPAKVVKPCESGWHFTDEDNLFHWCSRFYSIYEIRPAAKAQIIKTPTKYVASSVVLGKKLGTIDNHTSAKVRDKIFELLNNSLNRYINKPKLTKKNRALLVKLRTLINSKKSDLEKQDGILKLEEALFNTLSYTYVNKLFNNFLYYYRSGNDSYYNVFNTGRFAPYKKSLGKVILQNLSKGK